MLIASLNAGAVVIVSGLALIVLGVLRPIRNEIPTHQDDFTLAGISIQSNHGLKCLRSYVPGRPGSGMTGPCTAKSSAIFCLSERRA